MMTRVALSSIFAACLADPACTSEPKPAYVLVHGAWMGEAGWSDVAAELRAADAEVHAIDLPAHGSDPTPPSGASLDAYVASVSAELDAMHRPVVLVGHSMGGVVITQLAEQRPRDIARLVYVAAYVPTNGQSLFDLAMMDTDSQLGPSLEFNSDGTIDVAATAFPGLFCADCSTDASDQLVAGYRTEPSAPLKQPVAITSAGAGSVAKTYVHTSADRVVSPSLQARMVAATPMASEITLATSHAAMLAQPHELAVALLHQ